jgi:hypothetical protein
MGRPAGRPARDISKCCASKKRTNRRQKRAAAVRARAMMDGAALKLCDAPKNDKRAGNTENKDYSRISEQHARG